MIFVLIFVPLGGPSAASASHSPKLPELRSLPAALALSISPVSQSFSSDSREPLTPSSKQLTAPLHLASFHLPTLSNPPNTCYDSSVYFYLGYFVLM